MFTQLLHKPLSVIDDPLLDPNQFLSKRLDILQVLFNIGQVVDVLKLIEFHLILLGKCSTDDIQVENVILQLVELLLESVDFGDDLLAVFLDLLFEGFVHCLKLLGKGRGDLLVAAVFFLAQNALDKIVDIHGYLALGLALDLFDFRVEKVFLAQEWTVSLVDNFSYVLNKFLIQVD